MRVFNLHFFLPMSDESYNELQTIKSFLSWQDAHWNLIEGHPDHLDTVNCPPFIVQDITNYYYSLVSFYEVYEYFKKNGLLK